MSILDLANPNEYTTKEIKEKRRAVCKRCPDYFSIAGLCKVCGCNVKLKSKLKTQFCPTGKW